MTTLNVKLASLVTLAKTDPASSVAQLETLLAMTHGTTTYERGVATDVTIALSHARHIAFRSEHLARVAAL